MCYKNAIIHNVCFLISIRITWKDIYYIRKYTPNSLFVQV